MQREDLTNKQMDAADEITAAQQKSVTETMSVNTGDHVAGRLQKLGGTEKFPGRIGVREGVQGVSATFMNPVFKKGRPVVKGHGPEGRGVVALMEDPGNGKKGLFVLENNGFNTPVVTGAAPGPASK